MIKLTCFQNGAQPIYKYGNYLLQKEEDMFIMSLSCAAFHVCGHYLFCTETGQILIIHVFLWITQYVKGCFMLLTNKILH